MSDLFYARGSDIMWIVAEGLFENLEASNSDPRQLNLRRQKSTMLQRYLDQPPEQDAVRVGTANYDSKGNRVLALMGTLEGVNEVGL